MLLLFPDSSIILHAFFCFFIIIQFSPQTPPRPLSLRAVRIKLCVLQLPRSTGRTTASSPASLSTSLKRRSLSPCNFPAHHSTLHTFDLLYISSTLAASKSVRPLSLPTLHSLVESLILSALPRSTSQAVLSLIAATPNQTSCNCP